MTSTNPIELALKKGENSFIVESDSVAPPPSEENLKTAEDQSKDGQRSRSITPSGSDTDDGFSDGDGQTPPRSRSNSPIRTTTREPLSHLSYAPTADMLTNAVINMFTLVGSIIVFGIFLIGSYDYFKNVEENKCEMTWMFNRPYYVPITIGDGIDEKFPMYGLYAYTEGEQSLDKMSRNNYQFTGIPILYIPGNAGSYQQVRSFASVALWKHLDAGTNFHFDYFTVDLNEEFSALYGYTLQRQVEYTKKAVVKIVNMYEEFHRVVLVGHSMGGMIAKAVALGDDSTASLSNLILTLATPHHRPVTTLDPEQDIFYYGIKKNWTTNFDSSNSIDGGNKITLVSIAGGDRDHLVAPKLTRWPPFVHIHAKTTAVPGVWASTDHLCIVWCKQFVLTVTRALFDLIEYHQRNKYFFITENEESRLAILKYHLVERSGGKSFHGVNNSGSPNRRIISLQKNLNQVEASSNMYCVSGGQRPSYVLFPIDFLQQNVTEEGLSAKLKENSWKIVVLSTNTKDKNWLLGCVERAPGSVATTLCVHAENLSYQYGKIIPHVRRRRKVATIPLSSMVEKYSHLVVKMDSHPFKTCVMLETFYEPERILNVGGVTQSNNKIFFNFTMPSPTGLLSYLAAWKIEARPANNESCPNAHNLLAQFNHGNFQQSRFLLNESLTVRYSDWNVTGASVAMYLEPNCNYTIQSSLAPLETAGHLFRHLLRFLPSFYASIILMTLYFQKDPVNWSSFHILLLSNAYHLSIFPGFCIAVVLNIIPTDWPLMVEDQEYSVVIPILCYMIAYCLVLAVSTGIWYTIITGGTAVHSVIIRLLSTRFGAWIPRLMSNHRGFTSITEHVTEAAFEMTLTRFPMTVAVLLLALGFATSSGSLVICLTLVLHLVKLFKIYEDLLEDLLKAKITNVKDSLSPMNFHFCCFMLWLLLGILNVPSLLHWTRSTFAVASSQPWDISMYLCLLLLPTVAVLWQEFVPNIDPTVWKMHRYVFYVMGMACVLWGTHRLYVTAFLVTFVFLTLAMCQLVSVMMSSLSNTSTQQEQSPSSPHDTPSTSSATNNNPSSGEDGTEVNSSPTS